MITRSKLADQLRDYQIRSQHKWAKLTIFSPKPHLITRTDVNVARLLALLFSALVISLSMTLYFRYFRLSIFIIALGILLPMCLKISRQIRLARKRERRLLLPLSIKWSRCNTWWFCGMCIGVMIGIDFIISILEQFEKQYLP